MDEFPLEVGDDLSGSRFAKKIQVCILYFVWKLKGCQFSTLVETAGRTEGKYATW